MPGTLCGECSQVCLLSPTWWNNEFLFPMHAGHPIGISKSTRLSFNDMLVSTLYIALSDCMHVDGCIIVYGACHVHVALKTFCQGSLAGNEDTAIYYFYCVACFSLFPSVFIVFVIVLFKKYKFLAQVRESELLASRRIIQSYILVYMTRLNNQHCPHDNFHLCFFFFIACFFPYENQNDLGVRVTY